MSRASSDPYNAAYKAAHEIVRGVVDSILESIEAGEVTEDDLSDHIHEEVDNALIYTADQWVCAYGLPGNRDLFEEGLIREPANFGEALSMQAYLNLEDAVSEHDFSEAFEVAADLAEENTPEERSW